MAPALFDALWFGISSLAVLVSVLGVPGNLVPTLVAVGYWFFGQRAGFSGTWALGFVLLYLSGELVEQLASFLGAKIFGATKVGMLGAFLGGIVGAIVGSLLVPLIGTLVGIFVGCFALTALFELLFSGKGVRAALQAGLGALFGRFFALAYKYSVGLMLLALLAYRFWFA